MGNWKYVNWLIGGLILIQMYRYFYVRYDAAVHLYILATLGWLVILAIGVYIFQYKMNKPKRNEIKKDDFKPSIGNVSKERPKVNFNRKLDEK